MKFSRLRLLGFKSFVEPGEFVIEPGLTGVVGPNGCGKSNLVEALRWVMGESSHRHMRASGMEDVIFSGSATRPSRNAAEVTLFLDNADRTALAPFNDADELQVARRIERDAGSVYRINGREARARDVQLLFADQSTGARSPAMVGQGRIGELIQAKPQARRALLEEAAGISGLHARRHEAELRLRAAEQNMERLQDVVATLESQIESLKRQARQASRFKTLSADIRKAEATLLHDRWAAAKAQESEANSALSAATSRVAEQAAAQMHAAKDQAVGALRLPELRVAEAGSAAALQRLVLEKARIEEESARLSARRGELARRLEQLDADIVREARLVDDNAGILARLATEKELLDKDEDGSGDREARALASLEGATSVLSTSEGALMKRAAERAGAVASRGGIERALREATERRDRTSRRIAEADGETEAIAAKVAALPEPALKRGELDRAERERLDAEAAVATAESATVAARRAEVAARAPVQEARAGLARIETEARTLARLLGGHPGEGFPAVLEEISVERGFETALGAALGDDLAASLDANAPAHWRGAGPDPHDPPLPPGVSSLDAWVRAPVQLARRLAQTGVVDRLDGDRLQSELRPGQVLVNRDGAIWRWDGFVAAADAPARSAQRLAQRNRLTELEKEAVAAVTGARGVEQALRDAEAAVLRSGGDEKSARQALRDAERAAAQARDALARAEKASGEWTGRLAALDEARARGAEMLAETQAALSEAEAQLETAPDLAILQAGFEDLARAVERDRVLAADARAAHEGLKREAEARARRLAAIEAERQNWLARAENALTHIATLKARRAEAAAESEGLAREPETLEANRRALLTQLGQAETLRRQAADRLQEAENRQAALDKAANASNAALAQGREARARAEERVVSAEGRRLEAEARIREVFAIAPPLLLRHAGVAPDEALPQAAEIERRLDRLKVERERLGAVNLRAEEEQVELTGRLQTLVAERGDIVEAVAKLRQAIGSLNREGRERLLAAFEAVNLQFERLFTHLFDGGSAELQLIESDDPLEAGLEILARPPGKKPQTMTLLSGGEQALTAMALIFAVFLSNPAPICVLDEVDAPLDDHNVERFCNLLDEMASSTDTRFLVITHNPITMSRMNRLFGVTMAERGVSQLVSVDLRAAEGMREVG